MNQDTIKKALIDNGYEDTILFEDPDYCTAFIGVDINNGRAVYDYQLMVRHLVETDGMNEEDAVDFISYNTIRSLPYIENGPIVINDILYFEL